MCVYILGGEGASGVCGDGGDGGVCDVEKDDIGLFYALVVLTNECRITIGIHGTR